jgi:Helix-turn-helix domain
MSTSELAEPIAAGLEEAERLSGIGRSELYGLIAKGEVKAVKRGRRTLIIISSLREYLHSLPAYDRETQAATVQRAVEGRRVGRR